MVEPDADVPHSLGIEEVAREEGPQQGARRRSACSGWELKAMGFEEIQPEEFVREGMKYEEITKLIQEDTDIGVLVLGASKDPSGPWPARHHPCRRRARRHLPRADYRGSRRRLGLEENTGRSLPFSLYCSRGSIFIGFERRKVTCVLSSSCLAC